MKFCIIGGKGRMGTLFHKLFVSEGFEVEILDKGDDLSKAGNSEIIIVSVPISRSTEILEEISKIVKEEKLVLDFSSVMDQKTEIMKKMKCESAFIHPLFGPDILHLKSQNFVVVPINKGKKLDFFLQWIRSRKANVVNSNLDEHEKMMALFQCLTHLNSIVFAKTIISQGIEPEKVKDFSTTLFRLQKAIISKVVSQSPDMISDIQFKNKNVDEIINQFRKDFDEVIDIIKNKEKEKFSNELLKIREDIERLDIDYAPKKIKEQKIIEKESVAVLGPKGSYTDIAFNKFIETEKKDEKISYFDSIPILIKAVVEKKVKYGIIPIENSIHGTVTEALDRINYEKLNISKSIVIPINHCLAVHPEFEVQLKDVESVLSHPHALSQCSRYIEKNMPTARTINMQSTAEAFQQIIVGGMKKSAGIGPKMAAEIYGLRILDENIEDEMNNQTRFFIITKGKEMDKKGDKISISILPFHEKQGILFKLLQYFDDEKINLTKIESRPLKDKLGKYLFYIDLEGNYFDEKIQKAFKNISREVGEIQVMGCYSTIK